MSMSKFASRADYLKSLPCGACERDMEPMNAWPITDDLTQCEGCEWEGSGSYLHTCRGRLECAVCVLRPTSTSKA